MVLLYLPTPSGCSNATYYPEFCRHPSHGVSPYAKATALGWVGDKFDPAADTLGAGSTQEMPDSRSGGLYAHLVSYYKSYIPGL